MKSAYLIVVLGHCASHAMAQNEDSIATIIRHQTDVMANAGQQGDDKTVDRLTDDYVLFSAGDGSVQRDERLDATDAVADELRNYTNAIHGQSGTEAGARGRQILK